MLANLKLRSKMLLLVLSSLVGLGVMTAYSAVKTKQQLTEARMELIKSVVEAGHNAILEFQAEEAAGKLGREEAQRAAAEVIRTSRYGGPDGKTEYLYIWSMEGVSVSHPNPDLVGKNMLGKIDNGRGGDLIKGLVDTVRTNPGGAFADTMFPRPGLKTAVPKLQFVKHVPGWDWFVGTGIYMDDVETEFREVLVTNLLVSGVLIVLIAALGFAVARDILRQVGGEPMEAIDLMSRAASGDLTVSTRGAPKGSMLASMGEMVGAIRGMVAEIGQGARKLTQDSERISTAAREVALASQHQADATSSMAAAVEEMTVSVNHISESATDTERESANSASLAEEGESRVQSASEEINKIAVSVSDASSRIRRLEEHANEISSIAGVIKEIAGQTNLLALNAAIEAARAGEQGRGFAVVADEVRKLAERTSSATIEIEQMIDGIQSDTVMVVGVMDAALPQVEIGVQAAQGAGDSLRQIRHGAQSTLHRIREVADATKEQSVASTSIAQKVEEIAQMVEETSSAMKSTAEIAGDLESLASELNTLVSRFRV